MNRLHSSLGQRLVGAPMCVRVGGNTLAGLGVVCAVRWQSLAEPGMRRTRVYDEGSLRERYTVEKGHAILTPDKLTHFVKARIQNERRARGLPEVDDWQEFAKTAVNVPSSSGWVWMGPDDPRCQRYMKRQTKHKVDPNQVARKEITADPAMQLEDHPHRNCFTSPCDLKDPLSIADGLYKCGQIKHFDVKFTAGKIGWAPRSPIVSIMGHVDHGKTTLLDYLRNSNVAAGEAGGITQSIGAFRVKVPHRENDYITFIDTPGHKAFSEMRKAGAQATDMIVLVVSTVDGVQPQTKEVIDLAKEAHLPLLVAFNKIDRNPHIDRVRAQLEEYGVEFDDRGGDVLFSKVSAIEGTGVDDLLEQIDLMAAMSELHTPTPCRAEVTVIDSRASTMNKAGLGDVRVNGVVRCGTLKKGMVMASGMTYAAIGKIVDENGNELTQAPVGQPVELHGFKMLPKPGNILMQLTNVVHGARFNDLMRDVYVTEGSRETYFQYMKRESQGQIYNRKPDKSKQAFHSEITVNLILKAATFGQLQALLKEVMALPKIQGVILNMRITEVGGLDNTDIGSLIVTQNPGIVLNFGASAANEHQLEVPEFCKLVAFNVVYHGIQALKEFMVAQLPKIEVIHVRAEAACKEVFKSSLAGKDANAGGMEVTRGALTQNGKYRLMRPVKGTGEREMVWEGYIKQLRRFKDVVQRVETGLECGVVLQDGQEFKAGDSLQLVETELLDRDVEQVFAAAMEEEEIARRQAMLEDAENQANEYGSEDEDTQQAV